MDPTGVLPTLYQHVCWPNTAFLLGEVASSSQTTPKHKTFLQSQKHVSAGRNKPPQDQHSHTQSPGCKLQAHPQHWPAHGAWCLPKYGPLRQKDHRQEFVLFVACAVCDRNRFPAPSTKRHPRSPSQQKAHALAAVASARAFFVLSRSCKRATF